MGKGLHVLDKGWRAADAPLERARGHEEGLCRAAVQEIDQRRLFPGDKAIGCRSEADADIAVERPGVPFREGVLHDGKLVSGTFRDHHDRVGRSDGRAGERDTVEHEMRDPAKEGLVLVACRLALRSVGDHDRPTFPGSDRLQLLRRWKRGPTASAQTAGRDEIDQTGARRHVERAV